MNRRSPLALVVVLVALSTACGEDGSDSDSDQGGASGSAGAGASSGGASSGGSANGGSSGNAGRGGSSSDAGRGGRAGSGGASGNAGASGSSGNAGTGGRTGELCADRTGGALVDFEIAEETLRVFIENEAFITEAERLLDAGESRIPAFNTLLDGRDCDPQWSWHPDPSDVEFADFTIELCDGIPSYIEENKAEWLDTVGAYCPWSATVTAVTRR